MPHKFESVQFRPAVLPIDWERRKANGMWLCPRCAQQDLKPDGARYHADDAPRGKGPA
jgi:hypothetical protein